MSLIALFLLTITSFVLTLFKRRRASLFGLALSGLLIVLVGQGWLPKILLDGLQKAEQLNEFDWKARNSIVLLGIGTVKWPKSNSLSSQSLGFSRIHEAARLYFKCKKSNNHCDLFVTGGDPMKNGSSEAEVMRRELIEVGVQESDIYLESKSNNTFQNAQFTSKLLHHNGYNSIVIVTSGIHLSRSLMYFSHFGVKTIGSPSDQFDAKISFLPTSYNFIFFDIALHEYSGFLRYYIYNLLGWNVASSTPGTA